MAAPFSLEVSTSFRGLLILQGPSRELVFSRRFPTVERRLAKVQAALVAQGDPMKSHIFGYPALPPDEAIRNYVLDILEDKAFEPSLSSLPNPLRCSMSFSKTFREPSHVNEELLKEQSFPQGPVAELTLRGERRRLWPVLIIPARVCGQAEANLLLVGIVACGAHVKRPKDSGEVIDFPEVTSGVVVLEDLATLLIKRYEHLRRCLPECEVQSFDVLFTSRAIRKMLPFGSPAYSDVGLLFDSLKEMGEEPRNVPQEDAQVLSSLQKLSGKIPAWKVIKPEAVWLSPSSTTCRIVPTLPLMELLISERLSVTLFDSDDFDATLTGDLKCVPNVSGCPEVVIPVSIPGRREKDCSLSVHDSCTLTEDADLIKISVFPPSGGFSLLSYRFPRWNELPVVVSYHIRPSSPSNPFTFSVDVQGSLTEAVVSRFNLQKCARMSIEFCIPLARLGKIVDHSLKVSRGDIKVIKTGISWTLHYLSEEGSLSAGLHLEGGVSVEPQPGKPGEKELATSLRADIKARLISGLTLSQVDLDPSSVLIYPIAPPEERDIILEKELKTDRFRVSNSSSPFAPRSVFETGKSLLAELREQGA